MATNDNCLEVGSTREELGLFFGDFDKEECSRYFKRVRAVLFAKLPGKDEEELVNSNSSLPKDSGKEELLSRDVESLKLDETKDDDLMDVDHSDKGQLSHEPLKSNENSENDTNNKVLFGEDHMEGSKDEERNEENKSQEKSIAPLDEGASAPKAKLSWAALFKSNSDAPMPKGSTIVSVNYPEATSKTLVKDAYKVASDQQSDFVPDKTDPNALALADFLQKSIIHPANSALQLRGLINNANWCYINATLQSLLGCPSFYCLFKTMHSVKLKSAKPSSTPLTDTMMDFANEFSTLDLKGAISKGKKGEELRLGESFEPKRVYEILSILKFTLSESGKQQDAEEFLTFLLNGLHDEFSSLSKLIENVGKTNHAMSPNGDSLVNGTIHDSSDSQDDRSNDEKEADDEWEHVGRNNKSANLRKTSTSETFITRLFGGVLRSSVHHEGAKESAMLQPFFTLQLDIQAENIWNIKDAFENYFTKESIEGFTSSKTNSKVEASYKTSLEKLPQVLILHLKYFVYDKTGGCQKTHKHVEISRELEIPKDVLSNNLKGRVPSNQRTYELFAVEFHLGKHAAGGHYTTAVRHKDPIGWVYCNDNIIQKVHFNQITKQQKDKVPYLLFYERVHQFSK